MRKVQSTKSQKYGVERANAVRKIVLNQLCMKLLNYEMVDRKCSYFYHLIKVYRRHPLGFHNEAIPRDRSSLRELTLTLINKIGNKRERSFKFSNHRSGMTCHSFVEVTQKLNSTKTNDT